MKIKNAIDAREYIIEELKKTFVGPGEGHYIKDIASFQINPKNPDRHKQEILDQSPKQTYLSGLLYPQKLNDDNFEQISSCHSGSQKNIEHIESHSEVNVADIEEGNIGEDFQDTLQNKIFSLEGNFQLLLRDHY